MKTVLRISGVLSFLFFAIGGLTFLGIAASARTSDAPVIATVGCFFLGMGFFVGPMLLFASEKVSRGERADRLR